MEAEADIIVCGQCGTKNRQKAHEAGKALVCGNCKTPLEQSQPQASDRSHNAQLPIMNTKSNSLRNGLLVCGAIVACLLFINFWHHTQTKAAVQSIIDQYVAICNASKTMVDAVPQMRQVDTSRCPNDFRAAYLNHIQACEVLAEVEQKAHRLKSESESAGAYIEAFVRGLMADPFGKATEVRAAHNALETDSPALKPEGHSSPHSLNPVLGNGVARKTRPEAILARSGSPNPASSSPFGRTLNSANRSTMGWDFSGQLLERP